MLADHDGNALVPMGPQERQHCAVPECEDERLAAQPKLTPWRRIRYAISPGERERTDDHAAEADRECQLPVALRLRSRSQLARDCCDTLGGSGRSEARSDLGQFVEHRGASRIPWSEQRRQRLGDALGYDGVLDEFARDFASGNDVHQADVRDLHHAPAR